ncbi:MAG TPA: hypothetical protein VGY58_24140, partial [Gemmataceae bacterium]|nr:hypothetical protein [Gemmataceae bacterium]
LNYRFSVAYTQTLLGKALHAKGLLREAAAEFAKAKQNYRLAFPDAVKWSVDYNPAEAANQYAWLLVTCPDHEQRNASEAIAAAKRALDILDEAGLQCPPSMSWRYLYSNTLGVALYRAGKPKEAIETLKRSMKLLNGGTSWDWYPLAMAYFVTGDKKQALAWYHKAVSVKEPPKFDHYLEMDTTEPFRIEAETVLHLLKTEAKSLETSRN